MSFVQTLNSNSSPSSEDIKVSTPTSKAAAGWANGGKLNFLANGDRSTVKLIVEVDGKQFYLDKFAVTKNIKKDPTTKSPDLFLEFETKALRPYSSVTANTFTGTLETLADFGF